MKRSAPPALLSALIACTVVLFSRSPFSTPMNAQTEAINSQLLEAVKNGDTDKVAGLLKQGADPNARGTDDRTALLIAAVEGQDQIIQNLVSAGANVNATSGPQMTPLMAASGAGRTTAVRLLLRLGAEVNAQAQGGVTALMMAAVNGHADTVQALVDARADVSTKAQGGTTALAMAASEGRDDVVRVLRKAGSTEPIENICLDFDKDQNWCAGNREEGEKTRLVEYVKQGETVEKWTEMVTLITIKQAKNVPLDKWLPVARETQEAGCSKGFRFEDKGRTEIGGFPAAIFVVGCEKLAKNPDTDKSVWGKPETSVHLDIAGNQNLYFVQKATRRSDLSEATIEEWISLLKTARICDSQAPVPPCGK